MSEEPKKFVEFEQFGLKVRIPVDRDDPAVPPPTVPTVQQQHQHQHHHQQQQQQQHPPPPTTTYAPPQRPPQSGYRVSTANSTADHHGDGSVERQGPRPTSSGLNHRVSTVVASTMPDLPPSRQASREPMEFSVANEFSEMVQEPLSAHSKPLVVLDCANLGWMYGGGKGFEPTGIEIALHFFASFPAISVVAFIPAHYLKKKPRDGTSGKD